MLITIPPFFVTLVAGLLIAFALQLLLTSFGIAMGTTVLGYWFRPGTEATQGDSRSDGDDADAAIASPGLAPIGWGVGIGTILMINTVLFVACFLAVKLSLVTDIVLGATLGIAIWSAYLLVLVWLGSTAAGSMLGVTSGVVKTGWQGLRMLINAAFGNRSSHRTSPPESRTSALETVTVAAPNNDELNGLADLDWAQLLSFLQTLNHHLKQVVPAEGRSPAHSLQQAVTAYLLQTAPQHLTRKAIQRDFTAMITVDQGDRQQVQQLTQLNRELFYQVLHQRDDLPTKKIAKIVDRLESVRLQVLDQVTSSENRTDSGVDGVDSAQAASAMAEKSLLPAIPLSSELAGAIATGMIPLLKQVDGQAVLQQVTQQTGQLVHQLETTVLEQTAQVQRQAQQQISTLTHQARQGVDTARKTTAITAWWFFSTALTALSTAAIAGALAVYL